MYQLPDLVGSGPKVAAARYAKQVGKERESDVKALLGEKVSVPGLRKAERCVCSSVFFSSRFSKI